MAWGALLSYLAPTLLKALQGNKQADTGEGLQGLGAGFQVYNPGDPGAKLSGTFGGAAEGALGAYMQQAQEKKSLAAQLKKEKREDKATAIKMDFDTKAAEDDRAHDLKRWLREDRKERSKAATAKIEATAKRQRARTEARTKRDEATAEKARNEGYDDVAHMRSSAREARETAARGARALATKRTSDAVTAAEPFGTRKARLTARRPDIPAKYLRRARNLAKREVEASEGYDRMKDSEQRGLQRDRELYWARQIWANDAASETSGSRPTAKPASAYMR